MRQENGIETQPDLETRRRILSFIMSAGKTLLENGAEVFRVEQTMQHMARGYHLREFQAYVITNGIFASAGTAELFELRNVPTRSIHLGRVEAVNELSRKIAAGSLPIAQAEQALVRAQNMPQPTAKTRAIASAFAAFSFSFLFGGSAVDALVSLVAGMALGGYLYYSERRGASQIFERLTGAGLVSLICIASSLLCAGWGINASAAIIGAFMLLTPGVAFTMAIRDVVHSDYLSGAIRIIDAILIAASIAIGAGLVLWCQSMLFGGAV